MTLSELREFRRKLVKAHPLAVKKWPDQWCVYDGCVTAGISLYNKKAIFDDGGPFEGSSARWAQQVATTVEHIDALFANSIAALDARIAKMQEGK